jgi:hypothetical protein
MGKAHVEIPRKSLLFELEAEHDLIKKLWRFHRLQEIVIGAGDQSLQPICSLCEPG